MRVPFFSRREQVPLADELLERAGTEPCGQWSVGGKDSRRFR